MKRKWISIAVDEERVVEVWRRGGWWSAFWGWLVAGVAVFFAIGGAYSWRSDWSGTTPAAWIMSVLGGVFAVRAFVLISRSFRAAVAWYDTASGLLYTRSTFGVVRRWPRRPGRGWLVAEDDHVDFVWRSGFWKVLVRRAQVDEAGFIEVRDLVRESESGAER